MCGHLAATDFVATPLKRAIGEVDELAETVFRYGLRRWSTRSLTPKKVDPGTWLQDVSIKNGLLHMNFRVIGQGLGWAGTSCGGGGFMSMVMRNAFQFDGVDRVTLDFQGDCHRWVLFEGEQTCGGRPRADYLRLWGHIPTLQTKTVEELRAEQKVLAYLPGPEGDCGQRSELLNARTVPLEKGQRSVLTAAIEGLLKEWNVQDPGRRVEVTLEGDKAILDFQGLGTRLGFAGTACGSVLFSSSILKTAAQFEEVEAVQFRLRGSCENFFEWWEAGWTCFNYFTTPRGTELYEEV